MCERLVGGNDVPAFEEDAGVDIKKRASPPLTFLQVQQVYWKRSAEIDWKTRRL
ncbi:MAG: hypothetical protein Fur0021_07050 [Candidatus Promineifilaceae bacterium]